MREKKHATQSHGYTGSHSPSGLGLVHPKLVSRPQTGLDPAPNPPVDSGKLPRWVANARRGRTLAPLRTRHTGGSRHSQLPHGSRRYHFDYIFFVQSSPNSNNTAHPCNIRSGPDPPARSPPLCNNCNSGHATPGQSRGSLQLVRHLPPKPTMTHSDILQMLITTSPVDSPVPRFSIHETAPWIITARHGPVTRNRLGFWISSLSSGQASGISTHGEQCNHLVSLVRETPTGTTDEQVLPLVTLVTLQLTASWWSEEFYLLQADTSRVGKRIISFRWATTVPPDYEH